MAKKKIRKNRWTYREYLKANSNSPWAMHPQVRRLFEKAKEMLRDR